MLQIVTDLKVHTVSSLKFAQRSKLPGARQCLKCESLYFTFCRCNETQAGVSLSFSSQSVAEDGLRSGVFCLIILRLVGEPGVTWCPPGTSGIHPKCQVGLGGNLTNHPRVFPFPSSDLEKKLTPQHITTTIIRFRWLMSRSFVSKDFYPGALVLYTRLQISVEVLFNN